mmetsp:Transcript_7744/g.8553  ORF Transcript_7744/g.8553 Transcript_7744/m.8553 type:complete len:343 (+) Transcript_7744:73-1101(+)
MVKFSQLMPFIVGAIFGAVWNEVFSPSLSWKDALGATDSGCKCERAIANETVVVQEITSVETKAFEEERGKGDDDDGKNNNDGWHQINVFYGDRAGMLVNRRTKWSSQILQDSTVYRYLHDLEGGYFVDLAANDATMISNSYALEKNHNWKGICIEANSKYWARLAFRKCQVIGAVVGHTRMEAIEFNFGPKRSSQVVYHHQNVDRGVYGGIVYGNETDNKVGAVNPRTHNLIKRYTVPLLEIFERHKVPETIDYFSLDVEGAETLVMSDFPFEKYKFRLLTIERPKDDLQQILKSNNYTYVEDLGDWGEVLWAHASEMEGIQALKASLNTTLLDADQVLKI